MKLYKQILKTSGIDRPPPPPMPKEPPCRLTCSSCNWRGYEGETHKCPKWPWIILGLSMFSFPVALLIKAIYLFVQYRISL